MASCEIKNSCAKCDKGAGVTTCNGCEKSFCLKHIVEHRQDLALELDQLGQEHDRFRHDLLNDNSIHPILNRIDQWENESVTKIQVVAEAARADFRQSIDRIKNDFKMSIEKITANIQACRESDEYTEIDLIKWKENLKNLQLLFEKQTQMDLIEDNNPTNSISMIKFIERTEDKSVQSQQPLIISQEKFRNFVGRVCLLENGLVATCQGSYWDGSNIYGTRLYSCGQSEIRFRVENKGTNNIFFGIKTTSPHTPVQTLTSTLNYGWWEFEQAIESVNGDRVHNDRNLRTGDEVTLSLDCDYRQIRLQHHRINMTKLLNIDLEKCPFPWKILIILRSPNDSIRILN